MTDRTDFGAVAPQQQGTPAAITDLVDAPRPTLGQRIGSKTVAPWVFVSPLLAFGAIFFLLPLGLPPAYISFTRWDSFTPPRWVGGWATTNTC